MRIGNGDIAQKHAGRAVKSAGRRKYRIQESKAGDFLRPERADIPAPHAAVLPGKVRIQGKRKNGRAGLHRKTGKKQRAGSASARVRQPERKRNTVVPGSRNHAPGVHSRNIIRNAGDRKIRSKQNFVRRIKKRINVPPDIHAAGRSGDIRDVRAGFRAGNRGKQI